MLTSCVGGRMSDLSSKDSPRRSYLVPVFESLRRYDGLTAKRLSATASRQTPCSAYPSSRTTPSRPGKSQQRQPSKSSSNKSGELDSADRPDHRRRGSQTRHLPRRLQIQHRSRNVLSTCSHPAGWASGGSRSSNTGMPCIKPLGCSLRRDAHQVNTLSGPAGERGLSSACGPAAESDADHRTHGPGEPIPISTAQAVDSAASGKGRRHRRRRVSTTSGGSDQSPTSRHPRWR